jgi:hypothetical protein
VNAVAPGVIKTPMLSGKGPKIHFIVREPSGIRIEFAFDPVERPRYADGMSAPAFQSLMADIPLSDNSGQIQPVRSAPIAAVRTRGTVSPKRSFAGAAANGRVG